MLSNLRKGFEFAAERIAAGAEDVSDLRAMVRKISDNPLWNIAQTGAWFIPGYGPAISAGMAATAAWGRGESLTDAALAAARGAIPPQYQAAFDLGVGVTKGDATGEVSRQIESYLPEDARKAYREGARA